MSPSISSSDGGLSPSVPILSRPLGVRPGRDRGFPPIVSDLVEPLAVHPRPRPGFLPFPTDLDRHRSRQTSRRPSPLSTEPPSIHAPGRLLVVRPRLRPGLLSYVPDLGEPLDVHPRPHQACHCQPSEFAGPLVPQCWQACRCPSPASMRVFAVRRHTGQTSGDVGDCSNNDRNPGRGRGWTARGSTRSETIDGKARSRPGRTPRGLPSMGTDGESPRRSWR